MTQVYLQDGSVMTLSPTLAGAFQTPQHLWTEEQWRAVAAMQHTPPIAPTPNQQYNIKRV